MNIYCVRTVLLKYCVYVINIENFACQNKFQLCDIVSINDKLFNKNVNEVREEMEINISSTGFRAISLDFDELSRILRFELFLKR